MDQVMEKVLEGTISLDGRGTSFLEQEQEPLWLYKPVGGCQWKDSAYVKY